MNERLSRQKSSIPYSIPFEVSGKAGDVKEVSAGSAAGGKLFLFRGYAVRGMDDYGSPGNGSVLVEIKIAGRTNLKRQILTAELENNFVRGMSLDLLHPRQEAQLVIRFLKDCTWKGEIYGNAVEVQNEGYYTFVPPAEPCHRAAPRELTDPEAIFARPSPEQLQTIVAEAIAHIPGRVTVDQSSMDYYASSRRRLSLLSNTRCEHCWHRYESHGAWAWSRLEQPVVVDSLEPGRAHEIVVIEATDRILMTDGAQYPRDHFGSGDDWRRGNALHDALRTEGIALGSDGRFMKESRFDVYREMRVDRGDSVLLRVINRSDAPVAFRGKVVGYAFNDAA